MPTRKLPDPPEYEKLQRQAECRDPDHNVPSMMVFEPGNYEHVCPSCGQVIQFNVPRITC